MIFTSPLPAVRLPESALTPFVLAQATANDARSLDDRVKRDVSTAAPCSRRVAWRLDPRPATPAGRTWRPRRAQTSRPRVDRSIDRKDVRRGR